MKRVIFVILLIMGFIFYFITDRNELSNDYYDAINKGFLNKNYLKEDRYVYNTFSLAQDESNEVRDNIVKDMINDNDEMKVLYNNILDVEFRNKLSAKPLERYINVIMDSNNINEFINNAIMIENELGIDFFTRIGVENDFKDNSRNIVYLYPISFAFGSSSDYYVDDDYMAYKYYIKRGIVQLLEKYGMSRYEARLASSEIISFYVEVSSSSKLSDSYEDVNSYYNVVNRDYLSNVYTKFDFVKYLNDKGIDEEVYSLVDENQYKKINEYLKDEYLMLWKKVMLVKILSSYANYLDMDYRNIVISLNNSLTGASGDNDIEKDAINLVSNVFSDEIDIKYESMVITSSNKKYLYDLFGDIKSCFRKMLIDNDWLSDDTKRKALVKLDKMNVYIGISNDNKISLKMDISGDNLVENIISINKDGFLNELDRLENNKDIKSLSEVEVNAYYSPMDNSVYIPSSVMFLIDDIDNYYEVLGTVGMVIAHEITHGFDYNGSKFDEDGNLNNWWNNNDREKYNLLKNRVSDYYSKIEVIEGKYIDGDKTVNENIADMGALKVISGVAKEKRASNNDMKNMYSSFAKFWKNQVTDDYAKLLLLNDSHSPNKYRVNAVLSLIDDFYDVYNVYPWNDMYVSVNNRISVW